MAHSFLDPIFLLSPTFSSAFHYHFTLPLTQLPIPAVRTWASSAPYAISQVLSLPLPKIPPRWPLPMPKASRHHLWPTFLIKPGKLFFPLLVRPPLPISFCHCACTLKHKFNCFPHPSPHSGQSTSSLAFAIPPDLICNTPATLLATPQLVMNDLRLLEDTIHLCTCSFMWLMTGRAQPGILLSSSLKRQSLMEKNVEMQKEMLQWKEHKQLRTERDRKFWKTASIPYMWALQPWSPSI